VNPSGGVATTHAIGLNYSDKWGKKMQVTGSYFFNRSKNTAEEFLTQQFVDSEGLGQVYDETTFSTSHNTNHRANFRFEYEIDSSNSLIFRPSLSWQVNDGSSATDGLTSLQNNILNQTTNEYRSDLTALNFNNNLLWRHKFAKKGRTFSVNVTSGFSPKKGENGLRSTSAFFSQPSAFDTLDQQSRLDVNSWNVSTNFNYTEPLGESGQLMLEYQASYQQEESDKSTFDFVEATQGYDDLNIPLSNVFSNDYFTHRPGLGYSYRKGGNLMVMARASFQHAKMLNDQTFPQMLETEQTFTNVLPFAMLRWDIDGRRKNMRVFYRTNTNLPSIQQLQNVVDNSNPLQLRVGNPNLKQAYSHNLFMRYQATNTVKSTVFFAMIGGSFTNDYIANATYLSNSDHPIFGDLDVQRGALITQPVNLGGYRTLRSFVTYGVPVKSIKSNLNFELNWNFARTPGLLNEELNFARSHTYGAGLTFGSNISDQVDFTLSARPSYNTVENSLQTNSNNEYLSQNTRLRFNWTIIEGFILRTDVAHQFFTGLSEDFNQNYWLWNLAIGKKMFKKRAGRNHPLCQRPAQPKPEHWTDHYRNVHPGHANECPDPLCDADFHV